MQQRLPPALQFALVILFHLLTRLIFRFYLPSELIHLALAFATNAEKRAATRNARLLIAAHLDAKLLLNAFPFFLEVVHATMIAALVNRPSEKARGKTAGEPERTCTFDPSRSTPRGARSYFARRQFASRGPHPRPHFLTRPHIQPAFQPASLPPPYSTCHARNTSAFPPTLASRPPTLVQCRSPLLSHATLLIFAWHEQPRY